MSPAAIVIFAAIVLSLSSDVVLVKLGFDTISTRVRGWGLETTFVPLLGGALGGHFWHDLVPALPLEPVGAHVAFAVSLLLLAGIAQAMRAAGHPPPMELLAAIGWIATAATVPT